MSAVYRRIPATFGPETRFKVNPVPAAPFRAVQEDRFEALKAGLLGARLEQAWEPGYHSQLRRAANEAAALAWVTSYPLLVFPVLFEEVAEASLARAEKQQEIFERSRGLLAA